MDLEASLWFLTVVKLGSFSKAAKELRIPSSTVSRRIALLEEQLGTKLLSRNTRNMQLTLSGEEFAELVKKLEFDYQLLQDWRDNQTEVSGTLRVTAPLAFVEWPLSEWLIEFKSLYPKVKLQVVGSNEYLDFYHHQLDLAFRQGPLPDSDLKQRRLFELQYGIYASPDWLAHNSITQDINWLQDQAVINVGAKGKGFPWLLSDKGVRRSVNPKTDLLLESPKQAVKAAEAGLGMTYVSCFDASDAVQNGRLVPICKNLWPEWVGFYLVFNESSSQSKKLSAFINFIMSQQRTLKDLDGVLIK